MRARGVCVRCSLHEQVNCHSVVALYEILRERQKKKKKAREENCIAKHHRKRVCCCRCVCCPSCQLYTVSLSTILCHSTHTHTRTHHQHQRKRTRADLRCACIHRRFVLLTHAAAAAAFTQTCVPAHATHRKYQESAWKTVYDAMWKGEKACSSFACMAAFTKSVLVTMTPSYGCQYLCSGTMQFRHRWIAKVFWG